MSDKFCTLDLDEKNSLSESYKGSLPKGFEDLALYKVLQGQLDFYPGWLLHYVHAAEGGDIADLIFITKDSQIHIFDWQVASLMRFNKDVPIRLSSDNVVSYCEFFFGVTRVPEGQMKLIGSYDEFRWREEPVPQVRRVLTSIIRPPYLVSWDEVRGYFEVGVFLMFQRNLFEARVMVDRDGLIDIQDRTLHAQDMPLMDELVE